MKAVLFISFLTLISCGSKPSDANTSAFKKEVFKDAPLPIPYRILLPENYNADTAYPLVLVLHGAGERGNDNEKQLAYGAELFLKPEIRKKYPAIVVFPQCPEESYWSNVDRERVLMSFTFTFSPDGDPTPAMVGLQSLLKNLTATYGIDQKRVYIGGLSMGGMGTLEIVGRNPDTFAAAFSICGGAHPDSASKMAKTPLWIFHGDADMVVDYQHSVDIVDALEKAGADVKFTTYPGVNHNSWENAFVEAELLPWLFSHSK